MSTTTSPRDHTTAPRGVMEASGGLRCTGFMEPPRLMSDRLLVAQTRGGSQAAATELFERHGHRAWRAVYVISASRDAADDAVQEAFARAVAGLDTFDDTRPFAPWFARIAVNAFMNAARKDRRLATLLQEEPAPPDPTPAIDTAQDVLAAVRALPAPQRAVVILRYWLDLSPQEIAAALTVPVGTVHSRTHRALDQLRRHLGEPDATRR